MNHFYKLPWSLSSKIEASQFLQLGVVRQEVHTQYIGPFIYATLGVPLSFVLFTTLLEIYDISDAGQWDVDNKIEDMKGKLC